MPGVLKNLIDWTSRFRPQPFDGRHGLLLSASPSLAGGNGDCGPCGCRSSTSARGFFPTCSRFRWPTRRFADDELADPALRTRFEKNLQAFLSLAEAAKHYPCIKRAWVEFLGEPPGAGEDSVDTIVESPAVPGS